MSKLSGLRISQGTNLGDVERDCIGAALGYSVFVAQMLNELLPSTFILVCITPSGQSFSAYFFCATQGIVLLLLHHSRLWEVLWVCLNSLSMSKFTMQPFLLKVPTVASEFSWGNARRSISPCKPTWGFRIPHGSPSSQSTMSSFCHSPMTELTCLLQLSLLLAHRRGRKALLFLCNCLYILL